MHSVLRLAGRVSDGVALEGRRHDIGTAGTEAGGATLEVVHEGALASARVAKVDDDRVSDLVSEGRNNEYRETPIACLESDLLSRMCSSFNMVCGMLALVSTTFTVSKVKSEKRKLDESELLKR